MLALLRASVREHWVVAVILLNSLILFLRGFPWIEMQYGRTLEAVDYVCMVYFLYEVITKIGLDGIRKYFSSNWNRFDFLVVIVSVPILFAPIFELRDFSYLLLLRLVRLLRFFRLLRFIPDVDRVIRGLRRGLRASVGVFLGLGLYTFILGLASCYLFRNLSPADFGDPFLSIYSIFKVFTVEGWYEVADSMASAHPELQFLIRLFFVFAVSTGGLLGLSLANAVFVDEMMADNNDALVDQVYNVERALEEIRQEQGKILALLELRDDAKK